MHKTKNRNTNCLWPLPGDPEMAALMQERLTEARQNQPQKRTDSDDVGLSHSTPNPGGYSDLIEAIFGHSPYLSDILTGDPALLDGLVMKGPDALFDRLITDLRSPLSPTLDEPSLKQQLRRTKRRAAAMIAWADITGLWQPEKITTALSDLAEGTLSYAVDFALREASRRGAISEPVNPDHPSVGSGVIVLGMGKFGAKELNYSSDIDIIVLFDPEVIRTNNPDGLLKSMIRLVRLVVRLMDERTADGYVFRTDLRLRPDPGATSLALTVQAAEAYYESLGQNWERAAMIKARPVAGDRAAGDRFIEWLTPFVWRKNLDFAAIQDIHAIKRQINIHRGGGTIEVAGHNVKLGAGGIREIEFFAQTQQLIWGGRLPALRTRSTKAALDALVALGHVNEDTADDLKQAYDFLRRTEHRLQMVRDEQTHSLPTTEQALDQFARFLGYQDQATFQSDLIHHLTTVHDHYAALFSEAPNLGAVGDFQGNLVFTGADTDPDTIKTLTTIGFSDPERADGLIRGWHHGRYRAMRSDRARAILTELMPCLLTAMGETPEPDNTLLAFDGFLAGLPSGVQLFAMFQSNPELLALVTQLIGKAPRLAHRLSARPHLIDYILTQRFFDAPPDRDALSSELRGELSASRDFEDVLMLSRRWANDRRFQVGVQRLTRAITPANASMALSDIADVALEAMLPAVEQEFQIKHGKIEAGGMTVLALGRLGSRELTATSDLDLVFVYDPGTGEPSDGPRPLPPGQYFGRFAQRFIGALTAMTGEGSLYDVDVRLRPSGSKGPIAASIEAFTKYYAEDAWTWERLALCRARVVCGHPSVGDALKGTVRSIQMTKLEDQKLLRDTYDMREKLAQAKPARGFWDLKNCRGGLVDIAFIVHFLLCRYSADTPEISNPNTINAIRGLAKAGFLDKADMEALLQAQTLLHGLLGLLALTFDDAMPGKGGDGISDALAEDMQHLAGALDFEDLKNKVTSATEAARKVYKAILAQPAKQLPATNENVPLPENV